MTSLNVTAEGASYMRQIKISLTHNESSVPAGKGLKGWQRRCNMKEEDLPSVNDLVKSTSSISLLCLSPSLPSPTNMSQTPSPQHRGGWRAPGRLWYFSLSARATCPLLRRGFSPLPFVWGEGSWKQRRNTAGTYFTFHPKGRGAPKVEVLPVKSDPGSLKGRKSQLLWGERWQPPAFKGTGHISTTWLASVKGPCSDGVHLFSRRWPHRLSPKPTRFSQKSAVTSPDFHKCLLPQIHTEIQT